MNELLIWYGKQTLQGQSVIHTLTPKTRVAWISLDSNLCKDKLHNAFQSAIIVLYQMEISKN